MNKRVCGGSILLGALGTIAGCANTEQLERRINEIAQVNSQQTTTIARLSSENETLRGFYNEYRARLDTTPTNLATHEYEEVLRYATTHIELLNLRRMLATETTGRETADTAATTRAQEYERRIGAIETSLREYSAQEIVQGQTITDLRTRLERAETTLRDIRTSVLDSRQLEALEAIERARTGRK